MTKTQLKLTENLQDFPFQFDYPLSQQTYFKIGGPAEAYLELADQDQVAKLIKFCSQNQIKVTLIGGASNLLIDDQGIKGVVLKITADRFIQINETQIQADILKNLDPSGISQIPDSADMEADFERVFYEE